MSSPETCQIPSVSLWGKCVQPPLSLHFVFPSVLSPLFVSFLVPGAVWHPAPAPCQGSQTAGLTHDVHLPAAHELLGHALIWGFLASKCGLASKARSRLHPTGRCGLIYQQAQKEVGAPRAVGRDLAPCHIFSVCGSWRGFCYRSVFVLCSVFSFRQLLHLCLWRH